MSRFVLCILTSLTFLSATNTSDLEIMQAQEVDERISPTAENVILSYHDSIKNAKKSVVNIATTSTKTINQNTHFEQMFNDPFFKEFFGGNPFGNTAPQKRKTTSLGSGVIIAKNGYIITNAHVVIGADEIVVTLLENNQEYKAKVIGIDSKTDLAVIKIDTKEILHAITFANSDNLQEGDVVFAIGNPYGVGGTITKGIISALNKNNVGLNQYENFIQTDASINPGNSGGALIDSRGTLIGINSAIISRSGGDSGVGFAIPSNMAKQVAISLVKYGKIERGYLGVSISDLTKETKEVYKNQEGAIIVGVEENSVAKKAGLKMGDLIIRVNDKNITNANELKNTIGAMNPQEKIKIAIERGKKEKIITLELDKMAGDETISATQENSSLIPGLTIENINENNKQNISKNIKGVLVSKVEDGSIGYKAGFKAGDIIVQIGETTISNIDDFKNTLSKMEKGKKPVFTYRNGKIIVLVIP